MKKAFLFFIIFLIFKTSIAQKEVYSKVKIYADNKGVNEILKMGISLDDGLIKENFYVIAEISTSEINKLKASNFKMDVLIEDVSKFYVERFQKSLKDYNANKTKVFGKYTTPKNFELGSMGGFYTYDELLSELDSMKLKYPNIFKAKQVICDTNTFENRPIYWVKISDNADIDENEPEIMYSALHHAREPMSMQQLIFFMYYLLENYETDPIVNYLVNNTEFYFVPCVNPDGYNYIQTTNPNGGGMWRKNRHAGLGIDLNRNYGWKWGYNDIGSSPDIFSETYRGSHAFSEAETKNMRYFCNQHQFKIAINNHSKGNLLIYPWGYSINQLTPDSLEFISMAKNMTISNKYRFGTSDQTVNYITNGSSDDWMFGEQISKPKIMAFTSESGTQFDGNWPTYERILEISYKNISQNINSALFLHDYAKVKDISENITKQKNATFNFEIECLNLIDYSNFEVSIKPIQNSITVLGGDCYFYGMKMLDKDSASISYSINDNINNGDKYKFVVEINNGNFILRDTIIKTFGDYTVIWNDSCNTFNNWVSQNWNTTSEKFYSYPSCITDSKDSNYIPYCNSEINSSYDIYIDSCDIAILQFRTLWDTEADFDYVQLKISEDYGFSWENLNGKFTKNAQNYHQCSGQPIYDGQQIDWVHEEIDLSNYINKNVLFKFIINSDGGIEKDGFYFDDFKIITLKNSTVNVHSIVNNIENIEVYPNPAKDFIQIKSNNFVTGDVISINSITGNTIKSIEVIDNKSTQKVNVNELKSGIYFVTIKRNSQVVETKKLIVK